MARKKKREEHENHERWLVSYADFITLLFAFFVVMYALSSVNEGKYRVLSDALIAAFRNAPQSIEPIQIGEPIKAPKPVNTDNRLAQKAMEESRQVVVIKERSDKQKKRIGQRHLDNLSRIQQRIESALASLVERELITVKRTGRGLEIEINTSILFDSGKTLIQPQAVRPLTEIASAIKEFPNAILVEGFTDNVPIETSVFPSNWELSAGRAASVVHLFTDQGVDPFRLAATGYGQYRPVATNDTPEGRSRNRRVVVVILSEAAEQLYNLGDVVHIVAEDQRQSDINLDMPVSLIETPVNLTPEAPLPQGDFPGNLPLRGRGADTDAKQEQQSVQNILESINVDNEAGP